MNRYLVIAMAVLGLVTARLHSQMPAGNQTPEALLQTIKAKNAELLTKQEATLQALDEAAKTAEQIKIFAKRG